MVIKMAANSGQENQEKPRVGVFICDCGSNIAGVIDTAAVIEYAKTLDDYRTPVKQSCSSFMFTKIT